jgi:Tfp pilus assembly protein PilE
MDPTSEPLAKVRTSEEKSMAKAKNYRGMSTRACSAKAMNWTLESSKDPTTHEASTDDTCGSQTITRTTDALGWCVWPHNKGKYH